VTVLSTRDGSVLWRYFSYPNGEGITTLVGEDGTVYVEGYSGHAVATPTDDQGGRNLLAALNPRDGSVRWRVVGTFALYPLLRLDGDTLLTSEPGEVSAFRTTDGTRRWRQEWVSGDFLTATSSAVAVQADTTLYLLKLTDGLKVWKQELPAPGRATPLLLSA
jgi:outer membrane protein assembly factor BamB